MEINNLRRTINSFIKLHNRCGRQKIVEFCKYLGFKELIRKDVWHWSAIVLQNKYFVIKINSNIVGPRKPKEAVKTLTCYGNRTTIRIQPRVDRSKKAVSIAMKKFHTSWYLDRYDIHERNVGLLEGKPVIFDW